MNYQKDNFHIQVIKERFMRIRRLFLVAIMFIMITLLPVITACGQEETPLPSLSAEDIITNTIQKLDSTTSFHFKLAHEGGGTPIAMGLELLEATGDMTKPDKLKTAVSATLSGLLVKVDVITIGSTTYMTNPLTREWEILPESFSAIAIFDPNTGIISILSGIIEPTVEEGDNDHKVSYHIKGEIPVESLRPITLNSIEGTTVIVDIWVDPEDFSIDKVRLEGRITETEKSGIIRTLEFSDFDKKVEIEPPL
jgi:hypothetical protein